jgi:hypothetical protein
MRIADEKANGENADFNGFEIKACIWNEAGFHMIRRADEQNLSIRMSFFYVRGNRKGGFNMPAVPPVANKIFILQ